MSSRARTPNARSVLLEEVAIRARQRSMDLLHALDQCGQGLTEPRVHALRLAARHLQPILEVFRSWIPERREVSDMRRAIPRLLRVTGPLRDAQLLCITLRSDLREGAFRDGTLGIAVKEERYRMKRAATCIRKFDRRGLTDLCALEWYRYPAKDLSRALRRTCALRRSLLLERIKVLRADDPRALHKARLALKRYRYLIGPFAPWIPAARLGQQVRLKRLQARLGQWHDARALAEWFSSVEPRLSPALRSHCRAIANTRMEDSVRHQKRLVHDLARLRSATNGY